MPILKFIEKVATITIASCHYRLLVIVIDCHIATNGTNWSPIPAFRLSAYNVESIGAQCIVMQIMNNQNIDNQIILIII